LRVASFGRDAGKQRAAKLARRVVAEPMNGGSAREPIDIAAGGFNMVRWSDTGFNYYAISDTEWADLNSFVTLFRDAAAPK